MISQPSEPQSSARAGKNREYAPVFEAATVAVKRHPPSTDPNGRGTAHHGEMEPGVYDHLNV